MSERAIRVAATLAEREDLALELISFVHRADQREDRKAYLEVIKATLPFRPVSSSVTAHAHPPAAIAAACDADTMPVMATSGTSISTMAMSAPQPRRSYVHRGVLSC